MNRIIIGVQVLLIIGCAEPETVPEYPEIIIEEIADNDAKNENVIIEDTLKIEPLMFDKVLLKKYDFNDEKITYSILDSISTNKLKDSLNSNRTFGYMSAIENQNTLLLYKNGQIIKSLGYVNMQGKTVVYDGHKQFSKFIINFINTLTTSANVNQLKYDFNSADNSREALEYCQENSIPYEDGIRLFSKWMEYDGEFTFTYSALSIKRNDDSIKSSVAGLIPIEKFEITTPQFLGKNDSCKLTYRVYCDNDSYNKFISTEPTNIQTSKFTAFKPTLYIYTKEKSLHKIDKIKN